MITTQFKVIDIASKSGTSM